MNRINVRVLCAHILKKQAPSPSGKGACVGKVFTVMVRMMRICLT